MYARIDNNLKSAFDFILELMKGYSYRDLKQMYYVDFYNLLYRAERKQEYELEKLKASQNKGSINLEDGDNK